MTEQDPFLHPRRVDFPEQESSESLAQEKFDRLMQFDHYGVRFVNIDEYRAIFNNGEIGKDIYWFRQQTNGNEGDFFVGANPFPFSEYIKRGRHSRWEGIIANQANWDAAAEGDLPVYREYLKKIKEMHHDVIQSERGGTIREETLKQAYEMLKPIVQWKLARIAKHRAEIEKDIHWIRDTYSEEILQVVLEEIRQELEGKDIKTVRIYSIETRVEKKIGDDMRKADESNRKKAMIHVPIIPRIAEHTMWLNELSEENEKVLNDFLNYPDYLIQDFDHLRKVLNILGYLFNTRSGLFGEKDAEHQSYHVGLFIDDSVIKEGYGIWGTTDSHFDPQIHILGAISIMPNKELAQEMQSVSAGSHPIFAANGVCLYPRQKKSVEPIS